jgi:DNA-binding response OmpR family regulator
MSGPGTPAATVALLAHARHELRTPVNAIIGYSELLLDEEEAATDASLRVGLEQLRAQGRQLQGLIGAVLAAERLQADPAPDLPALAADARARLGPVTERALAGASALLAGDRESARADLGRIATALRQLTALLANPFAEAPPPAEPPAEPEPPATGEAPAAEELEALCEGRGGHVLIVDDNHDNRAMLARGLLRQGHDFALARDGAQALDMLACGAFDLVLLDVLMPGMDGFEVLRRLKDDPGLRHVPVIMISALDQLDAVVRCIETGAEDYLPRPFNPVLLQARVGACLEKKRLRDQELEYLRNVALVADAAAAVEGGTFDPDGLAGVAGRADALGRLARVFQSMAREVAARELRLRQQVEKLRVEVDEARKQRQVAEITETDYFQQLQQKVEGLRSRRRPAPGGS